MSRKNHDRNEPFKTWREVQDHQYDPGYWTGGRVHPIYHASRRGRYGCFLLPAGCFALVESVVTMREGGWVVFPASVVLVGSIICIFAASRMLASAERERNSKNTHSRQEPHQKRGGHDEDSA